MFIVIQRYHCAMCMCSMRLFFERLGTGSRRHVVSGTSATLSSPSLIFGWPKGMPHTHPRTRTKNCGCGFTMYQWMVIKWSLCIQLMLLGAPIYFFHVERITTTLRHHHPPPSRGQPTQWTASQVQSSRKGQRKKLSESGKQFLVLGHCWYPFSFHKYCFHN